jgi:hypothetical protein
VNAIWQFSIHNGSLPYWENVEGTDFPNCENKDGTLTQNMGLNLSYLLYQSAKLVNFKEY